MDWFLYDNGLRHERVKVKIHSIHMQNDKYTQPPNGQVYLKLFLDERIEISGLTQFEPSPFPLLKGDGDFQTWFCKGDKKNCFKNGRNGFIEEMILNRGDDMCYA